MLVLLDIGGNWTTHLTHLLEDLLKPSGGVRRDSLVRIMPTQADSNTGIQITIAPSPEKKIRTWKNKISFSVKSAPQRHDVVNSRELSSSRMEMPEEAQGTGNLAHYTLKREQT